MEFGVLPIGRPNERRVPTTGLPNKRSVPTTGRPNKGGHNILTIGIAVGIESKVHSLFDSILIRYDTAVHSLEISSEVVPWEGGW